mmetsp:Transcript_11525/g.42152  ORF Transcript_11525/g.42152 Transcript_11525/m.42152 type:complete len:209 (+) Transcript_11525:114-740(+)
MCSRGLRGIVLSLLVGTILATSDKVTCTSQMERDDRAATQLKQRLQQFYAENSQHFRLNETVFLCAEHKMGTAFVGTLIRKLLSLLPYDQRCILKDCNFEGGSSTQPAMCNMVELVNGTLQRVPVPRSSYCKSLDSYGRETPWNQWDMSKGSIVLCPHGGFRNYTEAPFTNGGRLVQFLRDPWGTATSNYAYTLKGTAGIRHFPLLLL